jgi:hypothetical protein
MHQSQTELIASAFCDCSLPKAQWTHEAHLRVGLWHLLAYSTDEALEMMRARITAYNVACGVGNTDSSGYHETITRFFVTLQPSEAFFGDGSGGSCLWAR